MLLTFALRLLACKQAALLVYRLLWQVTSRHYPERGGEQGVHSANCCKPDCNLGVRMLNIQKKGLLSHNEAFGELHDCA